MHPGLEWRVLTEKRDLVRNTLWNGLSQSAVMLVGFIFMPLLVDAFGLPNYGLFVLVAGIPTYAALLDLGIGPALTRIVAESRDSGDRRALADAVGTSLAFYTLVGVAVAAVMAALGMFAGGIFDVTPEQAEILRNMLWIGAALQLWHWPATTARHVLAGLQRYDVMAWTTLLSAVLGVGVTVFVLAAGDGPVTFMALNGAAAAFASLLTVLAARRLSGLGGLLPARPRRERLAAMFTFGWAVFILDLSDVLFYQQTDRVILGVMLGAGAIALYEASAKINSLVGYAASLTVSATMPLSASLDARGLHGPLKSMFVRGTKYSTALLAPIAVAAFVFARPLFAAWLGADYSQTAQAGVLQLLVLRQLISAPGLVGDMMVISKGRMGRRVPWAFALSLANVALGVVFVERWGIGGVAAATLVTHAVDFPVHTGFLLRELGVGFWSWLKGSILPVYPLLVVPAAVGAALALTSLVGSLPGLLACVVLTAVSYWAVFYRFGMSADERADIKDVLAAVRTVG